MAEIWHRRGVAATGHMARAKALASLALACHESAGRKNDANCFRVRLHPREPQAYLFVFAKKNQCYWKSWTNLMMKVQDGEFAELPPFGPTANTVWQYRPLLVGKQIGGLRGSPCCRS